MESETIGTAWPSIEFPYMKKKQGVWSHSPHHSTTIYFVIYGIISELTDKGQFQYLKNLKGPQEYSIIAKFSMS